MIQGSNPIPPFFLIYFPFTTTAAGTIDVTVDWTFDTSDLDLYLTRGNAPCSADHFNNGTCSFLSFSESTTAKPETLSVPNLPAGEYTLYVGNYFDVQESFSYSVRLTSVPGVATTSLPSPVRSSSAKARLSGAGPASRN